jgi:phosphoglycolate phosphatase
VLPVSGFRHVVWDWNGTLLDDARLCADIMNEMLKRRALPPISMDFYKAVIEFPVVGYYEKLGFDFSERTFGEVSDEYISLYQNGWRGCPLHTGAREAMEALRAAGVGQSVLSASKGEHLDAQLEFFGLRGLLQAATGADNHHGRGKDGLALSHLQALGLNPSETLFVGDTRHDAEVAESAGCDCLLVSFGHYGRERLAPLGLPLAEDFEEIVRFALDSTAV